MLAFASLRLFGLPGGVSLKGLAGEASVGTGNAAGRRLASGGQ